jgi:hypothetical protein
VILFRLLRSKLVWLVVLVTAVGVVGYGKRAQVEEVYDRVRDVETPASSKELQPDAEGVLVSAAGDGWYVALQADGRVVHVADTTASASPDDYRTWVATPHGRERLIAAIQKELARPAPSGRGPSVRLGEGRVVRISDALAAALRNPRWLGMDLASPVRPWVPQHLTVYASRASGSTQPAKRWPYAAGIGLRNDGAARKGGRSRTLLCLDGAEVAPLFQKLRGVDVTRVLVDDGQRWELEVDAAYPGQRLVGDPCPRV